MGAEASIPRRILPAAWNALCRYRASKLSSGASAGTWCEPARMIWWLSHICVGGRCRLMATPPAPMARSSTISLLVWMPNCLMHKLATRRPLLRFQVGRSDWVGAIGLS